LRAGVFSEELKMNKSIFVALAVLAVSTSAASAWTHQSNRINHRVHYANRAAPGDNYGPDYGRSGFWPGDVAGAAVGTAGAVAAGAVNTAGAIATAPFRPTTYGYYPSDAYAMMPGGPMSSENHAQHMKNLRDSGYNPKNDFDANGVLKTQ
jgi:hypothetical protein